MGEVNDTLCNLLEVKEYFTDFWNGIGYLNGYHLESQSVRREGKEYYRRLRKKSSIRRDVLMRSSGCLTCMLGVEIMDTCDYTIPARLMEYNVQEVKRQLNDIAISNNHMVELQQISWEHGGEFLYGVRRDDRILPVATIGLYCGWEDYDGADSVLGLSDMKSIPVECRGMFEDYPVKIYSMKALDENRFETGLRELVGVFKRSKNRQELKQFYAENKERFARLDGFVIDAMAALLGESKLKIFAKEGSGLDLCKAFDDEREEGRSEGIQLGRIEGRDIVNRLIQCLIKDGRSEEILTVVSDEAYQGRVLQEYGLI